MHILKDFVRNYLRDLIAIVSIVLVHIAFFVPSLIRFDFQGDFMAQQVPHHHFILSSLRSAEIPFWFPYSVLGLPGIFKPDLAVMHPVMLTTQLINYVFNRNESINFTAQLMELTAHLWWMIGAVGMYLFLRVGLRLKEVPSLFGALSFSLTPGVFNLLRVVTYLGYALLPWLFLTLLLFIQTARFRYFLLLVICHILLFASGYPYFFVYFIIAEIGLVILFGFKRLVQFIANVALSGLLCSFFLLPYLGVFLGSYRSGDMQFNASFHLKSSLPPSRLIGIINPLPFDNYIVGCWLAICVV